MRLIENEDIDQVAFVNFLIKKGKNKEQLIRMEKLDKELGNIKLKDFLIIKDKNFNFKDSYILITKDRITSSYSISNYYFKYLKELDESEEELIDQFLIINNKKPNYDNHYHKVMKRYPRLRVTTGEDKEKELHYLDKKLFNLEEEDKIIKDIIVKYKDKLILDK